MSVRPGRRTRSVNGQRTKHDACHGTRRRRCVGEPRHRVVGTRREEHALGVPPPWGLEIVGPEGDLIVVSSPKQRALLLYLLVNRGRVYSADRILDAVWEEDTPTIKAAQFDLSKLRDVLEPRRARGSDGTRPRSL